MEPDVFALSSPLNNYSEMRIEEENDQSLNLLEKHKKQYNKLNVSSQKKLDTLLKNLKNIRGPKGGPQVKRNQKLDEFLTKSKLTILPNISTSRLSNK